MESHLYLLAAAVYATVSLVTFIALWRDKVASRRGGWRTPEVTLHTLEFLGGWPGSLLGRRLLRHKSRKWRYRLVLWTIVAVHAAVWVALTWQGR